MPHYSRYLVALQHPSFTASERARTHTHTPAWTPFFQRNSAHACSHTCVAKLTAALPKPSQHHPSPCLQPPPSLATTPSNDPPKLLVCARQLFWLPTATAEMRCPFIPSRSCRAQTSQTLHKQHTPSQGCLLQRSTCGWAAYRAAFCSASITNTFSSVCMLAPLSWSQ